MEVELKLHERFTEPKVIICTDQVTDEIQTLLKRINGEPPQILSGFRDGALEILDPDDILRFYAAEGKVFAATEQGEYYPLPQDLTVQCGSEIRAVLLQTVFALLYGAAWGASVIWEANYHLKEE